VLAWGQHLAEWFCFVESVFSISTCEIPSYGLVPWTEVASNSFSILFMSGDVQRICFSPIVVAFEEWSYSGWGYARLPPAINTLWKAGEQNAACITCDMRREGLSYERGNIVVDWGMPLVEPTGSKGAISISWSICSIWWNLNNEGNPRCHVGFQWAFKSTDDVLGFSDQ